jgi:hypothetical protein
MDSANQFAAVSFGNQDAGSGPVHSSPNLGPVTTAIHNISARNLSEIPIPDDRQFLRSWRRTLQECLNQHNAKMLRFLIADSSCNAQESEVVRRCNDILTKYSRSSWNSSSPINDIILSTDMSQVNIEIEKELGMKASDIRDLLRKTIRMYAKTATAVCTAETQLEEKLIRLETVVARINDLLFLEPTSAMDSMEAPTKAYLESVLNKIHIQNEYEELIMQSKKFGLLKGIVMLSTFQKPTGPICSICMIKDVNQAVTPCGHTFCEDCCRNQMTACYICRVQIRDKIRLYFS